MSHCNHCLIEIMPSTIIVNARIPRHFGGVTWCLGPRWPLFLGWCRECFRRLLSLSFLRGGWIWHCQVAPLCTFGCSRGVWGAFTRISSDSMSRLSGKNALIGLKRQFWEQQFVSLEKLVHQIRPYSMAIGTTHSPNSLPSMQH